jgi:hypothetical protein
MLNFSFMPAVIRNHSPATFAPASPLLLTLSVMLPTRERSDEEKRDQQN